MAPKILKLIIVRLLPYLTKSPPNIFPKAIPTNALVDNTVMLKSITYRSLPHYSWYLRAGDIGPVAASARPNYILLMPIVKVIPIKYDRLVLYSSFTDSDFSIADLKLVDALSVRDAAFFFTKFEDSSSSMLSNCFSELGS